MKQEILIAIVAASSALCWVIISQTISLLQSFLNKKHEKQKLLRQKYEEMMFHFSSSLQWIQQVNMCRTQQEIFALAQCPDTRKALSLCLLYFPDLAGPANDYLLAQLSYYEFVIKILTRRFLSRLADRHLLKENIKHQQTIFLPRKIT